MKKMIAVALTAVFASLVVLSFSSQPKGNAEFAGRAIFLDDKPAQLMAGRAIFSTALMVKRLQLCKRLHNLICCRTSC